MNKTYLLSLLFFLTLSSLNAQRLDDLDLPCLEDAFGNCLGGRITVTIDGPSSVYKNKIVTYDVIVENGQHFSTTYVVSGGTKISESKTHVTVKWTSIGTSRYVQARAITSSGAITRYRYVNVNCALPTTYTVTGGGGFCPGESGVKIGLNDSQSGASYQLKRNGSNIGSPKSGTGNALSFGSQGAGTYTVVATKDGCTRTMSGSKTVYANSDPIKFTVTGGGNLCDASGFGIGLSDTERGVGYQLKRNGTNVGFQYIGTGNAISFGIQSVAGTYTVEAIHLLSQCSTNMYGNATIYSTPPSSPLATISTKYLWS